MVITISELDQIRQGKPILIESTELGISIVVVRADLFPRNEESDAGTLPMSVVGQLVDATMAEEDADDPLLASYQP